VVYEAHDACVTALQLRFPERTAATRENTADRQILARWGQGYNKSIFDQRSFRFTVA